MNRPPSVRGFEHTIAAASTPALRQRPLVRTIAIMTVRNRLRCSGCERDAISATLASTRGAILGPLAHCLVGKHRACCCFCGRHHNRTGRQSRSSVMSAHLRRAACCRLLPRSGSRQFSVSTPISLSWRCHVDAAKLAAWLLGMTTARRRAYHHEQRLFVRIDHLRYIRTLPVRFPRMFQRTPHQPSTDGS